MILPLMDLDITSLHAVITCIEQVLEKRWLAERGESMQRVWLARRLAGAIDRLL